MESSEKLWKGTEPLLFLATAWALAFLFGRAQRGKFLIKINCTYCPLNKDQKRLVFRPGITELAKAHFRLWL